MRNTAISRWLIVLWSACAGVLLGCQHRQASATDATPGSIRVATFNTAMSRDEPDALRDALSQGDDPQAKRVAEVLQRTRPDIVLLQEVDLDPTGQTYDALQQRYLGVAQNGAQPIVYPYRYAPQVNTGVSTGVDLNADGEVALPQDAHGWGNYPGHYGMVILSMYPIDPDKVQSFREARWAQADAETIDATGYYDQDAHAALRLSSKTHDIVPIDVAGDTLHLLIAHPTPPVFDGPEDRNGYRNAAEIALLARMVDTLPDDAFFVILGDLNADPNDGDSRPGAMDVLLNHDLVQPIAPTSEGAAQAAQRDAGANRTHRTDPATDTADWLDIPGRGSGNLRVDYVLPSATLDIRGSGVYWPTDDDPFAYLLEASDHRLVWADLASE